MNQGAQSEATLPGCCQVANANATVSTSLLLTPSQQLIGLREGVCQWEETGGQSIFNFFFNNHIKAFLRSTVKIPFKLWLSILCCKMWVLLLCSKIKWTHPVWGIWVKARWCHHSLHLDSLSHLSLLDVSPEDEKTNVRLVRTTWEEITCCGFLIIAFIK